MTQISATNTAANTVKAINGPADEAAIAPSGFSALGHDDFLRLMVAQLQQQDPFEPVDNKDMLAQMAQFTALAGSSTTNETLAGISDKLDALIAAQKAAIPAQNSTPNTTEVATEETFS